jgi:hypothetical protein
VGPVFGGRLFSDPDVLAEDGLVEQCPGVRRSGGCALGEHGGGEDSFCVGGVRGV